MVQHMRYSIPAEKNVDQRVVCVSLPDSYICMNKISNQKLSKKPCILKNESKQLLRSPQLSI